MPPSAYLLGQHKALSLLHVKTANTAAQETAPSAPPPVSPPVSPSGALTKGDLAQGAMVAGLGAAPFMGMIGEKPIIHDPLQGAQGTNFKTMHELSRAARPGDVLLTSKPKGSIWKNSMTPFTGSEFYHAQPVTHMRKHKGRQHGVTVSAGGIDTEGEVPKGWGWRDVPELIPDEMAGDYPDVILLRPKQKLTPGQARSFANQAILRAGRDYDLGQAMKAWAKDMFLPKIPGITDRGPQTICEGNVCSTLPSQALKDVADIDVVPGKAARDVMPADFMRSENFELVGSKVNPDSYRMNPTLRRARPYLSRAGLGLAMAGTGYAATEYPEFLGAIPGAIAGNAAASALASRFNPEKPNAFAPTLFDVGEDVIGRIDGRGTTIKNFAKRRAPVILAGTALGTALSYLSTKKLREMLGRTNNEE